jgi:hypothetical protein
MSYSVDPLKTVQVLEPRTRLYNERVYAIFKGGRQISWTQISASSSTSTSQILFSAPPPNSGIIVDRKFWVKVPVLGTFVGTGSPLLQLGTNDGFRQFPLNSCISTTNLVLNNSSFSINTSEVLHPLLTCNGPMHDYDIDYSLSPAMADSYQNYSDWTTYGSARNPLALYGENAAQTSRGAFPVTVVNPSGSAVTATVAATLTEELFLSPLKFGPGSEAGLIGLTSVQLTLTLLSLSRMWSHATTGNTFTSVSFVFSAAPQLLQTYITPQLIPAIPRQIMYPYFKTEFSITQGALLAGQASTSMMTSNIIWPSIPKVAYLYIRERTANRDYTKADSFAVINSVAIQFNNMSGILANASQQDLYNIAISNGCQLSWPAWTQYRGSVLPVVFGKDVGLDAIEAPGLGGNYSFTATINYSNPNPTGSAALQYDMYVVFIQEGIITITEGNVLPQVSVISPKDILDSKESPFIEYKEAANAWGGDFFGSLKNYLGKFVQGAQAAVPYIEKALPYVTQYAPHALKLLGVGKGKKRRFPESVTKGDQEESSMSLTEEDVDRALFKPTINMSRSQMLQET